MFFYNKPLSSEPIAHWIPAPLTQYRRIFLALTHISYTLMKRKHLSRDLWTPRPQKIDLRVKSSLSVII